MLEAKTAAARNRRRVRVAALVAGALVALWWIFRSPAAPEPAASGPVPVPTAPGLDLSGSWHGQVSKALGGNPPRPVLKEISIETSRDGTIAAARLVFTDPGRGGAGAGYRIASDGLRRLGEASRALEADPRGSALVFDFLRLPGWIPDRPRLWRVLEGSAAGSGAGRYLLLESLETDDLIQVGLNESGFLSYAFFSPAYAPRRGEDALSRIIQPEPGASLRGFRNLVWDLAGAADFLTLQLPVTVSGPEDGAPDALTLVR